MLFKDLKNRGDISMLICINPGHGGKKAPGAVGKSGLLEKDVNLAASLALGSLLEKNGHKVIYTRKTDVFVSLKECCSIANKAHANYFISIHCNSFFLNNSNGTETFCLTRGYQGELLAKHIQPKLVKALKTRDRGVKTKGYYVLKYTNMPAILIELAFISNNIEEQKLKSFNYKIAAAQAICNGFEEFLDEILSR
jgi:N-acetylmuramoyl-L-alanine amidase